MKAKAMFHTFVTAQEDIDCAWPGEGMEVRLLMCMGLHDKHRRSMSRGNGRLVCIDLRDDDAMAMDDELAAATHDGMLDKEITGYDHLFWPCERVESDMDGLDTPKFGGQWRFDSNANGFVCGDAEVRETSE